MIRCSLCQARFCNSAQLDHYIDYHKVDPETIWITDAIIKNSGEAIFTYKRIPMDLALDMNLEP